jgi:hypothetical protein
MDFEIASEITEVETIAIGVGIRDRKDCGRCMVKEDGVSGKVLRRCA